MMNSNPISCDRCGHTSNPSAEVCAYCGAVFSSSENTGQLEADSAAIEPNAAAAVAEAPVSNNAESGALQAAAEETPPSALGPVEDVPLNAPPAASEFAAAQPPDPAHNDALQKASIAEETSVADREGDAEAEALSPSPEPDLTNHHENYV